MKDKMAAVFDGKRLVMKKRKKGRIDIFVGIGQSYGYSNYVMNRMFALEESKLLPRKKKKKLKKLLNRY